MRLPSYLEVSESLQETGEAEYAGHTIVPIPFKSTGYTVNGPDIDGEDYEDLESALAAIRATIQEPE